MSASSTTGTVSVKVGWTEYTGEYCPPLDGWRANAPRAWAELEMPGVSGADPVALATAHAELLFEATNRYAGPLWAQLQALLPAGRGHTALSVGDCVQVGEIMLSCESVGWKVR